MDDEKTLKQNQSPVPLAEAGSHKAQCEDLARELTVTKRELRAARDRYTQLFDISPVGNVTLDNLGRVMEVNLTAAKLLDVIREDMVGKEFVSFAAARDKASITEHFRRCKALGQATCELHLLSSKGEEAPVELHSLCCMSSAEPQTACRTSIADISDRVAAQEQRRIVEDHIRRAQMLDSLGSAIDRAAHDFNNSLMVILGNAEMASSHVTESSEAGRCLGEIRSGALQARDLTRQMLTYVGKGKSTFKSVDLNSLLAEVTNILRTSVSDEAEVTFMPGNEIPEIQADAVQIRQLARNLVINAVNSLIDGKGRIEVRTATKEILPADLSQLYTTDDFAGGNCVVLSVSDTGGGLDQRAMDELFKPSFTTKIAGPGLGLSAVIGIVRGHQGAIKVDSEPGQGTTFEVYFPCALPIGETEPHPEQKTGAWQATGSVLIVDDEPAVLETLRKMCSRLGFTIYTACDGAGAIDELREHAADITVVLLDYEMPGMSCAEAFESLQQIKSGVPVIVSSGYAEEDTTAGFSGEGVAGFIQKPYDLMSLSAKFQDVLAGTA